MLAPGKHPVHNSVRFLLAFLVTLQCRPDDSLWLFSPTVYRPAVVIFVEDYSKAVDSFIRIFGSELGKTPHNRKIGIDVAELFYDSK